MFNYFYSYFLIGDAVYHKVYGYGEIVNIDLDYSDSKVYFYEEGYSIWVRESSLQLIDYDYFTDYGYEVNYKLYYYFIYFQLHYKQQLTNFVPRI